MKRIVAAVFAVLALMLSGCGGQAAGFSESDLILNVGGNVYRCRDNIQTIIADLGEGYTYAEGKSCNYDGLDKTYTYEQATFYTNPLSEGDLLSEVYTESDAVTTSKGLAVGTDKAAVIAAYGEPAQQDKMLLVYRLSEKIGAPSLCFELEDARVIAIYLTMETV